MYDRDYLAADNFTYKQVVFGGGGGCGGGGG